MTTPPIDLQAIRERSAKRMELITFAAERDVQAVEIGVLAEAEVDLAASCDALEAAEADRDTYNDEIAKVREIVHATSENVTVDVERLVERLAEVEAKAKVLHEALRGCHLEEQFNPDGLLACSICGTKVPKGESYKGPFHAPNCPASPDFLRGEK